MREPATSMLSSWAGLSLAFQPLQGSEAPDTHSTGRAVLVGASKVERYAWSLSRPWTMPRSDLMRLLRCEQRVAFKDHRAFDRTEPRAHSKRREYMINLCGTARLLSVRVAHSWSGSLFPESSYSSANVAPRGRSTLGTFHLTPNPHATSEPAIRRNATRRGY